MSSAHTQQQLGELIDCADVAVRAASQLRILKAGQPAGDMESLTRAVKFLEAAKAGGAFMSGREQGLHSTLRPLNWAADIRYGSLSVSEDDEATEIDYEELTSFLDGIAVTASCVIDGRQPEEDDLDACISFLESLGNILSGKADRTMRRVSGPEASTFEMT